MLKVLSILLLSASTQVNAQVYYKNVCSQQQVATWQKMNDQMKQIRGQDHPQMKKKLDYCKRFNEVKSSGQCDHAISQDEHGRSAAVQLKNGGPYNRCLQDAVR